MIPDPDKALRDIAGRIGTDLAARIPDSYGKADAGMISLLLIMLADDARDGIERRLADCRALVGLFETAAHAPGTADRQDFVEDRPAQMSYAAVSAWQNRGLELLIQLHAWAEDHDDALDRRIWAFLYAHTERHSFDL